MFSQGLLKGEGFASVWKHFQATGTTAPDLGRYIYIYPKLYRFATGNLCTPALVSCEKVLKAVKFTDELFISFLAVTYSMLTLLQDSQEIITKQLKWQ